MYKIEFKRQLKKLSNEDKLSIDNIIELAEKNDMLKQSEKESAHKLYLQAEKSTDYREGFYKMRVAYFRLLEGVKNLENIVYSEI